jgi:hypothetical protein
MEATGVPLKAYGNGILLFSAIGNQEIARHERPHLTKEAESNLLVGIGILDLFYKKIGLAGIFLYLINTEKLRKLFAALSSPLFPITVGRKA